VFRVVQINLNHDWAAQDVLTQHVAEYRIDLACVSEPVSVPRNSRWLSSLNKQAAIFIGSERLRNKCIPIQVNNNFVVARCEWFHIISVYISPNDSEPIFNAVLDEISETVCNIGGRCIISGDFNAKSSLWGSPVTNRRGSIVERWAAGLDLNIVNTGSTPTCVRHNGWSIVDLTWTTSDIFRLLSDWQVLSDAVSMSDHKYIVFRIGDSDPVRAVGNLRFPCWNMKTFDRELFREALDWFCSGGFPGDTAEAFALGVSRVVSAACNISASRLGARAIKRGVYWWSEDLAQARRRCVAARRLLYRAKRRNRPFEDLRSLFKKARSAFAKKIRKAKAESWDALLRTLDEDPWGIPYKLVMDRLRTSGPSMLESLEPVVAERLLDDLFPWGEEHDPDALWGEGVEWSPEYEVTCEEVRTAIRARRRGGCPAPGPDGLSLAIWKCVPNVMVEALAALFTLCLRTGRIPDCWKRAILVLISKGQFDAADPKARPICLLNEVGKFFERILDRRLKIFKAGLRIGGRPARVLRTGMQFGFTEGVSTTDALKAVISCISDKLDKRRFVIAVSLDIRNAFNSISWGSIRWALERDGYSGYLRRVLDGYLSNRFIDYPVRSGGFGSRRVTCGVPQGSVLGPLLWNIAYDFSF